MSIRYPVPCILVALEREARVAARTRELNDANERLRERDEERGQVLRKVITAQEDERKRIARELHDETSQALAVLAMGLEAAQDAIRSGKTPVAGFQLTGWGTKRGWA